MKWEKPECGSVKVNWDGFEDGVELCSELNIHKAVFEGDVRNVIEVVQSFEEEISVFGSLIDDVKFFFKSRSDWKIQFVYREKKHSDSYLS